MRPVHEFVQPAKRGHPFGARTEHQVIGVGENDVRAGLSDRFRQHGLDGRRRPHRHERRRADRTALHAHGPGPRRGIGGNKLEGENTHGRPCFSRNAARYSSTVARESTQKTTTRSPLSDLRLRRPAASSREVLAVLAQPRANLGNTYAHSESKRRGRRRADRVRPAHAVCGHGNVGGSDQQAFV